jgi:hypothetical protein
MAKLGYTWYPKDWGNSESVFELNLSERGLYRELIDLAMMQDNKVDVKKDVWQRKFAVSNNELEDILNKLIRLNLVKINENILFIPSCETRLQLSRGGKKGGKKSKPNTKPIEKPIESLLEKNEKPTSNQREREIEKKEKIYKNKITIWLDKNCPTVQKMKEPITYEQAEKLLNDFPTDKEKAILADTFLAMENHSQLLKKYKSANLTVRNWVKNRFDSEPKTQLGKADKWTHPDQVDITDLDFFSKIPKPPPIEDAEAQHQWSCTWKVQQHRQYISDNNL